MRVVVEINADKLPELYEAIVSLPVRARAMRVCMLATLGAMSLSGQGARPPAIVAPTFPAATQDPTSTDAARAQALKAKLRGDV
ncbi:MAG: hypothetical protein ACYCXT_10835 [Acidiferrobacteraceae bacterium]